MAAIAQINAPAHSYPACLNEKLAPHDLHFPCNTNQLMSGTMSYHAIDILHLSHLDRPFIIPFPFGHLSTITPIKLPVIAPINPNKIASMR